MEFGRQPGDQYVVGVGERLYRNQGRGQGEGEKSRPSRASDPSASPHLLAALAFCGCAIQVLRLRRRFVVPSTTFARPITTRYPQSTARRLVCVIFLLRKYFTQGEQEEKRRAESGCFLGSARVAGCP
jgi:hypothetical protein